MIRQALVHAVLVLIGLVALGWLGLQLNQVLLLVFAAIVLATLLHAAAGQLLRIIHVSRRAALALVAMTTLLLFAGIFAAVQFDLFPQFATLANDLPPLVRKVGDRLGIEHLDAQLRDLGASLFSGQSMVSGIGGAFADAATALIVVAASVYLAANPELYSDGVLRLVPQGQRPVVQRALHRAASSLRGWIGGQMTTMAFIGAITGVAMWALGLPSALALGVLAAMLEIVPFLGPIGAALPAAIIALASDDPFTVVWVLLAYLVIQQLEGNVLSPLIQQWAVRLPPALGLFALLVGGTLFGPLGVLLATPATVVILAFFTEVQGNEEGPGRVTPQGVEAPSDDAR